MQMQKEHAGDAKQQIKSYWLYVTDLRLFYLDAGPKSK